MHTPFPLLALSLALATAPALAIDIGHRTTGDKTTSQDRQMAWRYRTLAAGLDAFERSAPALAPGAALAFALPKLDPAEAGIEVVLQHGKDKVALPMAGQASFTLVRLPGAGTDARVLANRQFQPGQYLHPDVRVRTPGLAPETRRLGDLRLACAVQTTMAKNDTVGLRAVMAAASLFSGTLCDGTPVTNLDAPVGSYQHIVIDDGTRRVVQPIAGSDAAVLRLGDASWGNDTRIQFVPTGNPVQ